MMRRKRRRNRIIAGLGIQIAKRLLLLHVAVEIKNILSDLNNFYPNNQSTHYCEQQILSL
jgi:hypothetical protein